MTRLILILFLSIILTDASYAQKPNRTKAKETTISTPVNAGKYPLKDSAFLSEFAKMYGDSIWAIMDSLLKDTSFLKSIGDSLFMDDYGEFISPRYEVQIPVKAAGWTNDYEHIFSKEQIAELDSMINNFEKETTNEIAILTIGSYWATAENFDSLTLAVAREWGVGKKGKNNGVLIGVSTGLRRIRIQNGSGIEAILSNEETKKIVDDIIIPEFKKGFYFEGVKKGVLAIMQKIR